MNTKITFLGSGSAFSFANGQNNLLLEIEQPPMGKPHRMLVDAGDAWKYMALGPMYDNEVKELISSGKAKNYRTAVAMINLKIATGEIKESEPIGRLIQFLSTIDSIFLTHNHGDHNASLELIGFLTRFVPALKKIKLYGMSQVLRELWDHSLSASMDSLNYGQMTEDERRHRITLESYFEPIYLSGEPEEAIKIGSTVIEPFTTMHISNRLKQVVTSGILIRTFSGREIMFTSDTQYCPKQLIDMYKAVDVIFHDCETSEFPSGVHAHINDLKNLPKDVKDKLHLCHFNDGFNRSLCAEYGFAKVVEMGDSFVYV